MPRSRVDEDTLRTQESQKTVDQAWEREIDRRIDRLERGEAKTIPLSEARKQIAALLKGHTS